MFNMATVRTKFPLAAATANTSLRPQFSKTTIFFKLILSQSFDMVKREIPFGWTLSTESAAIFGWTLSTESAAMFGWTLSTESAAMELSFLYRIGMFTFAIKKATH
jgi:hypothetical protein